MGELPIAPFERIIKKAGAHRVGEDAKERLREVVEEYALELAAQANTLAEHAKRTTVRGEDIALARKQKK